MSDKPSFTVTKIKEEGKATESSAKGFAQMKKELKGMEGGELIGKIGDTPEEPEMVTEELSDDDEKKREQYIELLQGVLRPHRLGKLVPLDENKERLFSKLERLTLIELKEFVPSKYKSKVGKDLESLPAAMRAEINMRYKDISP